MKYQGDIAQQESKLLPTTTEVTNFTSTFSVITYYIRKIRSSIISVFIADEDGIRNRTNYTQGHLVATKNDNNQTTLHVSNGNLIINSASNEVYTIDDNGHLKCTTTKLK
jgi:hypothetical protein